MTVTDPITTLPASRIIDCSPEMVRAHARAGRLPSIILPSGQRLFEREVVERFAQEWGTRHLVTKTSERDVQQHNAA